MAKDKYFIILCGFPGSGKSTIAKKIKEKINCVICSMDYLREKTDNNCLSQENNDVVFYEFHNHIKRMINKRKNIVIDAQNLRAKDRKFFLKLVDNNNYYQKICVFVDTSLEQCIINNENKNREHYVPISYYEKLKNRKCTPTMNENWDKIYIVNIDFTNNKINTKIVDKQQR